MLVAFKCRATLTYAGLAERNMSNRIAPSLGDGSVELRRHNHRGTGTFYAQIVQILGDRFISAGHDVDGYLHFHEAAKPELEKYGTSCLG